MKIKISAMFTAKTYLQSAKTNRQVIKIMIKCSLINETFDRKVIGLLLFNYNFRTENAMRLALQAYLPSFSYFVIDQGT